MKIADGMLYHYITLYITDNDWDSDDPNQYCDEALQLKAEAVHRNDLVPLTLGLDHLLCQRNLKLSVWIGNAWTEHGVRSAIEYVRKILNPDAIALDCEQVPNVEIIKMGEIEWWEMRTIQGLHPDFSKKEEI